MANGENSANETELKANVDLIERNLADLKSATQTSIWVGRLVLLVISVVILLQILSIYRLFQNVDKNTYMEAAQNELESLLPKVYEQAGTMAENLAPVYQEALLKEFDSSMPQIAESFSKEFDLFVAHVGDNIQKGLDHRFKRVLDKQLDILAKEMPELKDNAKRKEIMNNVLDCAENAAKKLSSDLFKPQIEALANLSATIETVEIPNQIQKMNDSSLLYFASNKIGDLFLLKMVIFEDIFVESVKQDIKGK